MTQKMIDAEHRRRRIALLNIIQRATSLIQAMKEGSHEPIWDKCLKGITRNSNIARAIETRFYRLNIPVEAEHQLNLQVIHAMDELMWSTANVIDQK